MTQALNCGARVDREAPENLDAILESLASIHRKVETVVPFHVINDRAQSPFSPVTLVAEDVARCVAEITHNDHRAVVISEVLEEEYLGKLRQAGKNIMEIDLRTEEGVLSLEQGLTELIAYLEGGNFCLVVKGLEVLESAKLQQQQRYALSGLLRRLKEHARGSSLLIGVVSRGEIMPLFVTHEMSPVLLDVAKVGFQTGAGLEVGFNNERVEERWKDPRRDIEELEGAKRRRFAMECEKKVRAGDSLIVFGPRRGGKTSIQLSVRHAIERTDKNVQFYCPGWDGKIGSQVINVLHFKSQARKKKCLALIEDKPLSEVPGFISDLLEEEGITLSGERIVFIGDETLPHIETKVPGQLYEIAAFLKRAKELGLPISLLSVEWDFDRGDILNAISRNVRNTENVELSAFSVEQIGLFDDGEARELIKNLIGRGKFRFRDESSMERFIQKAIAICSGNVFVINSLMSDLNIGKSVEEALESVDRKLQYIFDIYTATMTGIQREIIQTLLYSKGHTMLIQNAGEFEKELLAMQRRGFINFQFRSQDRREAVVTLRAAEGFKLVFGEYFKRIAYKHGDEESEILMRQRGYSEEQIRKVKENFFTIDDSEDERLFRDWQTVQNEAQEILLAKARRGECDINEAFVPGSFTLRGDKIGGRKTGHED
ncbi:MAG: hypothetical protein WC285_04385 [Candidatus Gracilibacteria bacterium]|jgi:hypothetical protein